MKIYMRGINAVQTHTLLYHTSMAASHPQLPRFYSLGSIQIRKPQVAQQSIMLFYCLGLISRTILFIVNVMDNWMRRKRKIQNNHRFQQQTCHRNVFITKLIITLLSNRYINCGESQTPNAR